MACVGHHKSPEKLNSVLLYSLVALRIRRVSPHRDFESPELQFWRRVFLVISSHNVETTYCIVVFSESSYYFNIPPELSFDDHGGSGTSSSGFDDILSADPRDCICKPDAFLQSLPSLKCSKSSHFTSLNLLLILFDDGLINLRRRIV